MDGVSDADWLGSLDARARNRFERTVRELAAGDADDVGVRRRVREDMEQRHAPLAFDTFLDAVAPDGHPLGGELSMSTLLSGFSASERRVHSGLIDRAGAALTRLEALGASSADLEPLLHLAQLRTIDNVGFWLCQGGVSADLPGWCVVEKWDGEETGRPLSHWEAFVRDYAEAQRRGGDASDSASEAAAAEVLSGPRTIQAGLGAPPVEGSQGD